MFGRLRHRLDNARQMQKMRNEHPEEIRRLLEERAREQQVPVESVPVKSGPWIIFFRCILYLLTVLIVLITFIGGRRVMRLSSPYFPLVCCWLFCI